MTFIIKTPRRGGILFLLVLQTVVWTSYGQQNQIDSLIRNYDYQRALALIDSVYPDSMDLNILYLKSMSLKEMSRFPEAIDCYNRIYKNESSNTRISIELADCYKSVMNYDKPEELYLTALKYKPGNRYLMQMLAGIYMTTEQFAKAKEWYLHACLNDTSVFLLKQLGWCCYKLLQDDEAEFYYKKAMHLDPDDYQPVFRLGNLYKDQRDYELAIAVTDSFLNRHPDNREVTRLSGYSHYLNQTFGKSIARFQSSIELSDSSAFVLKYLGYSYFKLAEYPNAIKYMEKFYALDSSDADLCWALGLAHDVPQNIKYFQHAIDLGLPVLTAMAKVYLDLSLAYTKAWRYNDALDALNNALNLKPGDAGVIYKLAVHYDNWMDDKASALKYYKEFMATRPDVSSDYFITGISVINQSDYFQAERRIIDIENKMSAVVTDSISSDSIIAPPL